MNGSLNTFKYTAKLVQSAANRMSLALKSSIDSAMIYQTINMKSRLAIKFRTPYE